MKSSDTTRQFHFYPLEDRVLLSGEGMDGAGMEVDADPEVAAALLADVDADGEAVASASAVSVDQVIESFEREPGATTFDPALPLEVIFIDAGVDDPASLLGDLRDTDGQTQWLVVRLDAAQDGIAQISDTLRDLSGVDAIHLLSHGDGGGIQLGNTRLDGNSAEAYAGQISSWASAMDTDADLLIYGCDLAGTEGGRDLIDSIAELCQCDVAASDDATGHADLGGDWTLEYQVGLIESSIAFGAQAQQAWFSTLATATFSEGDANGYSGTQDTELDSGSPDADRSGSTALVTDLDEGGDVKQAMIRFDSIFGGGVGQIPDGAIITSASLTLTGVEASTETISLHRMLQDWNEGSATWNSMSGGLSADGIEMEVVADSQYVSPGVGSVTFNGLEKTIQRWLDGGENYGWGILNNSVDGFDFASSESGNQPLLSVDYVMPGTQASTAHTLTVDTTLDVNDGDISSIDALLADKGADGLISLREALLAAEATTNDVSGPDLIQFNLSTADPNYIDPDATPGNGDEYWTITPEYFLRFQQDAVIIDGQTQSGYDSGTGRPVIEIDGSAMTGTATFVFSADGNTIKGLSLTNSPDEPVELQSSNNIVQNMWIGVDPEGNIDGNPQHGIMLTDSADNNQIGGTGANEGNVIAGTSAGYAAIIIQNDSDNNIVEGNMIGVLADGVTSGQNMGNGILIQTSSDSNRIGGTAAGAGNVISGNGGDGIYIDGTVDATYTTVVSNTLIQGNIIGLDSTGTTAVGNGDEGISIQYNVSGTIIGGTTAAARNLISGNDGAGILIQHGSTDTLVQGNYIGTDITGTLDLGNGKLAAPGDRSGIRFFDAGTGNVVGGTAAGASNLIAFNEEAGVSVLGTSSGVAILGNSMHSNTSLAIDLGGDGVSSNDAGDADGGANETLNYPEFTSVSYSGGSATVDFDVDLPAGTYRVEFFSNTNTDPSGNGEGETFLHAETITHTGSGSEAFSAIFTVDASVYISATVTADLGGGNYGSTSEFSSLVQANPAGNDTATTDQDTVVNVAAPGVLANDNDPFPGQALQVTEVEGNAVNVGNQIALPSGALVTLNADGSYSYDPNGAFDWVAGGDSTTDQFTYTVSDNTDTWGTGTVTMTINGINDAPVITASYASTLYTENDAPIYDAGSSVSDVDSADLDGGVFTFSMAANGTANDRLGIRSVGTGSGQISTSGSNVLYEGTTIGTYSGGDDGFTPLVVNLNANATVAATQALGRSFTYSNVSDDPSTATRTVRAVLSDGDGGTSAPADIDIYFTAVNDEQVLATNTGTTVSEGATGTVITNSMLHTTDVDNSDSELVYTVDAVPANGTLYNNGVALVNGGTFTQADVDAGLITYDHDDSETSSDGFDFTVNDGAGTTTSATFNVTVTPVNDNTPTITSDGGAASANLNRFENDLYVTTVVATDADLPADTLTYSIAGGADSAKFSIDSSTGILSFVAAPDFESPTDAGLDNIYDVTVQVSDGTYSDTQAIAVTIDDVADDGQFLDLFSSVAYNNSDGSESWSNSWVESEGNGAGSGDFQVRQGELRVRAGSVNENIYRSVDLSTAVSSTLSFTYNNSLTGSDSVLVQISGDGGSNYTTLATMDNGTNPGIGSFFFDVSSYQSADTRIRFMVASTSGGNALTFDDVQFSYVPNTAPTITSDGGGNNAAISIDEGTTAVTTVTTSDPDAPGQSLTYSIIGGADAARFNIDSSTGELTLVASPDFESPTDVGSDNVYNVQVQVSDGIDTDTQSIAVTIDDVDEFDVGAVTDVDGATNEVDENASVGTVVGVTASASDADGSNNTITYSLADNDGGRFAIDSNTGVVTVAGAIDREADGASRNITVRATSSDGSFTDQGFTIGINDLDEFDVGVVTDADGTANEVDENASIGTVVGVTASASDADSTNNTITYSLIDNDGGRFAIDSGTGVVTVAGAIDREADGASRNITVRATSTDGSFTDQGFTIGINDLDEFDISAVTDNNGAANEVDENAANGTTVGITALASDADATTNNVTYTLDDNAGGRFAIDSSTGVVTVADGTQLNFEAATSHNITVRATSADGSFDTAGMTINVNDLDEFDVGAVTDVDGAANEVDENASIGTVVGVTASASDADGSNNTITYSLTDNDGGRFAIDSSTGVVTVAGAIDREADGASRNITVRATSTDGSFTDQGFTIGINDLDEFDISTVTDNNGAANEVDENAANGTTVGITALASDADATTNNVAYTLDDNAGGRFAIDSSTGVVTVADGTQLNFEAATSHNITVRATSADGSFDNAGMTINVNDLDEFDVGAVTDVDGATNEVDENASIGTVVGVTASASDADGSNNTITYSLIDNDGGRFAIDSGTGVVTVAGAIDREADGASRNITVRATSTDGSFTDQGFTIGINDLDEFDISTVTDNNGAANEVDENAANGTAVGITALASDADATTNNVTYTLDDNAGGRFAIDGSTGVVTVADGTQLNFEAATSHNITVRATSADGSFDTAGMTINVNDLDEFDVGAVTDVDGAANEVDENASIGTVVGVTASASDADGSNNTITYSLTDNDGGRFAIDSSTGVVTVAGAIDREADGASRNITVRATSTDGSFTDQGFTIGINDLDEFDISTVTDNNGAANEVDENAANGTTVGITALASDADATTNNVTYTLDDNAGGRFAIDSSTGVVTVADGTQLNFEAATSHNITIRATSADGSFDTAGMTINVNDLDEFDVGAVTDVDGAANEVDENASIGTVVGVTASASDADGSNNTITYSLADNDGGRFAIDSGTGVVTVAGAIDREADGASRNITVRATSSDGSFTDQGFTIGINDLDEFDVGAVTDVDGAANEVDENASIGTVVGVTASASDADSTNSTITYSLTDNDGGRFAIDSSTGVVTVAGAIDREADGASRNITVRATSTDGSFTDQGFTIGINDLDEFDISAVTDNNGAANEVDENAANGTAVGITALASDADATNNNVTYTLDDNAGGRFAIDSSTGVVTVADGTQLNFEAATSHNITVRATSADGSFDTAGMTINVNDLDEFDVGAVTDVNGAANEVDENASIGTVVGVTASASDADGSNNTITYSLTDNDGGRFAIDSSTGVVTVAGAIDREADGASRNITVRATSTDGSFTDQGFAIGINDLDEFDIGPISDSDAAANEVAENSAVGTVVGLTGQATDGDATNSTITYSLDDDASGRFSIDSSSGVVRVAGGLDYESNTSHGIVIRATSADGSSSVQAYSIDVTDVNEAGATVTVDTDAATNTVSENAAIGSTVGVTAFANDSDGTDTISYSLDDNDGGRFAIDATTGVVTVAGAIDREADGASRNVTVRSTSTDGSFTTSVFSIAIEDVDEFDVSTPVDSDAGANEVNENAAFGTTVGVVALASDGDATDTLSYTLDDSAAGRFAIDGSSGVVSVSGAIDYETATSHNITIRVTSTDGSTQTQIFSIDVLDVNEAPVTFDDSYSMFAGTTFNEPSPGVIFNDTDVDGDTLTTVLVTPPSNGTLTLLAGGGIIYTPNGGFTGTDTFFYRATDGSLQGNLASVEIEVAGAPAPDPPTPPPSDSPEPEPEPQPEPEPEPEPESEPVEEDSGSPSESTSPAAQPGVFDPTREVESADREFAEATRSWSMREGQQSNNLADRVEDGGDGFARSSAFLQPESQNVGAELAGMRSAMMDRLLALDLEQAIVWQVWDQNHGQDESAANIYFVGTAGSAVSLVSVGYVLWALRGGALMTAVASSIPSWRVIDPTALLSAYRSSGRKSDGIDRMLG